MSEELEDYNEPKKGTYTIELDNLEGGKFIYIINPIDAQVYYAMSKMLRLGKQFEAYVFVVKSLKISGDDPDILLKDTAKYMPCLIALDDIMQKLIEPCAGELKKN